MKTKKIFLKALMMALLLAVMVSGVAFAKDKIDFKIRNFSDENVVVKLYGENDYEVTVKAGKTETITIPEGDYDLEYFSCGTAFDDTLELGKDFTMIIYACDTVPTKMRFDSHFADDLVVEMTGPEDYDFDISLGKNRVDLFSGWYVYTYEACDGTIFSGEVRVFKNGTTVVTLHGCEWYDSPARTYAKPVPVKVRIINHGNFPVDVTLSGPDTYTFSVLPGVNIFQIIYGTYHWSYYVDYEYTTGLFKAEKNGISFFIITPNRIYAPPEESAPLE